MKTFRIRPAIFYGLNTFVAHMPFLVGAGLVVSLGTVGFPILYALFLKIVFNLPGNLMALYGSNASEKLSCALQGAQPSFMLVLAILAGVVITALINMWAYIVWVNIGLKLYDTKYSSIHDLFSFMSDLPQLISISIAITIVSVFGLIALIIPGIYWIIRSYFSIVSALDKSQEGFEPIRTSFAITKGIFWRLVLFLIVLAVLNLIIYIGISGFTQVCSGLVGEAQEYCMIITGGTSLVATWICATVSTFIQVHVYRQLVPRS